MAVIPLTLVISLCLVFTFVVFFLIEHSRSRYSSAESQSILPLAEESPRLVPVRAATPSLRHRHDASDCGCARGERPACDHCLNRRAS
jgi:hypothetical protein